MLHFVKWLEIFQTFTGIQMLKRYMEIIIAHIGFGITLLTFKVHGFMKSISHEIKEANSGDGCGKFKIFLIIVFTILKPIYRTILILVGIWICNDFLFPLLGVHEGAAVQIRPLVVHNLAGAFLVSWNFLMTSILMVFVSISVFFLAAQKPFVADVVEGSVR